MSFACENAYVYKSYQNYQTTYLCHSIKYLISIVVTKVFVIKTFDSYLCI